MSDYKGHAEADESVGAESALVLTESEWMTLRSIVCEFVASVGDGHLTDDEASIVDRIIEATDA